jgi:hypothetical protein
LRLVVTGKVLKDRKIDGNIYAMKLNEYCRLQLCMERTERWVSHPVIFIPSALLIIGNYEILNLLMIETPRTISR